MSAPVRLLLYLLLLVLVPSLLVAAPKKPFAGFKSLAFGSSYKETTEYLDKDNIIYFPVFYDSEHASHLKIEGFELGSLVVTVLLFFDHENRFYSFTFKTESHSADLFERAVAKDGQALDEIFKSKYGKPLGCNSPSILNVGLERIGVLCKWGVRELDVFTGIAVDDFEYYSLGRVASKRLSDAYTKHKEQEMKKGAAKAVDSF